jgi:hypothetical protein
MIVEIILCLHRLHLLSSSKFYSPVVCGMIATVVSRNSSSIELRFMIFEFPGSPEPDVETLARIVTGHY